MQGSGKRWKDWHILSLHLLLPEKTLSQSHDSSDGERRRSHPAVPQPELSHTPFSLLKCRSLTAPQVPTAITWVLLEQSPLQGTRPEVMNWETWHKHWERRRTALPAALLTSVTWPRLGLNFYSSLSTAENLLSEFPLWTWTWSHQEHFDPVLAAVAINAAPLHPALNHILPTSSHLGNNIGENAKQRLDHPQKTSVPTSCYTVKQNHS